MNKEQFNNLTILEQVEYINGKLSEGFSNTKIANDIGIERTTFRKRFLKNNYIFDSNKNAYLFQKTIKDDAKKYENEILRLLKNDITRKNLIELVKNYNKIEKIIDDYEKRCEQKYESIIEENLLLKLELEKDKFVRTTIKIHEDILQEFNKYCNKNKNINKQNLYSIAIRKFLDDEKNKYYNK